MFLLATVGVLHAMEQQLPENTGSNPEPLFYFAFGSNMNVEQYARRMNAQSPLGTYPARPTRWNDITERHDTHARFAARLPNHELTFDKRSRAHGAMQKGFASIRYKAGSSVWGVVYPCSREDMLIMAESEGGYTEVPIEVEVSGGQGLEETTYAVPAITFVGNMRNAAVRPEHEYLYAGDRIIAGVEEFNHNQDQLGLEQIPPYYVEMLRAITTISDNSGGKLTKQTIESDRATTLQLTCQVGNRSRAEPDLNSAIDNYIHVGTNVHLTLGSERSYIRYVPSGYVPTGVYHHGYRRAARAQLTNGTWVTLWSENANGPLDRTVYYKLSDA